MTPIEACQRDYQNALDYIDKCDQHIFKIRNWALVTSSAVIAFAITHNTEWVVLVNLLVVSAFLYMELIYKSLQDDAISHSVSLENRIQKYIDAPDSGDWLVGYKFGIGGSLSYPSLPKVFGILKNPTRRHISNFYGMLVLFSFGAMGVGIYVA